MCLAVPAQIEKLTENQFGIVQLEGLRKKISLELVPEAGVGDYVIVHVGYALSVLDKEEAEENIRTLEKFREIY